MDLMVLEGAYTVCKLVRLEDIPWGVLRDGRPLFVAATGEELSLVCPSGVVPAELEASEPGWRMLRVAGSLEFSLVGIIAGLAGILARHGVSVFVVSTFDTDYLLVKEESFPQALELFRENGYRISEPGENGGLPG